MIMKLFSQKQLTRIRRRFQSIYGDRAEGLESRFFMMIGRYGVGLDVPPAPRSRWSESDVALITYADTLYDARGEQSPLQVLKSFCERELKGATSIIHLLPFFPWSSDDGFSVIDYREVAEENGTWRDVEQLGQSFNLMFDWVLNHCSSKSAWFRDFVQGVEPASRYFVTLDPETDLSCVVRPRTSPVLTAVSTRSGTQHVWTTFSPDQVDLDWRNPEVFFEFLDILFLYISKGAKILRLDAVAFLWKEAGSSCVHLPQTHEIIQLFRDIVEALAPQVLLLTETNVPHEENISYFGGGQEAHMVYNFSLPPLLAHALLRGNGAFLTAWARDLSPPPKGCTYFNFTASHDGLGVRPLTGLVPEQELAFMVGETERKGGRVSFRALGDGTQMPYELNITYVSLLGDSDARLGLRRFFCSQALALSFRGMPAVYIHSLLGTPNWEEGFQATGRNRTLNRRRYEVDALKGLLDADNSLQGRIFELLVRLLRRRTAHPAFHPDAEMIVHDMGSRLFALSRIACDGSEVIICLYNLTAGTVTVANPQSTPLLREAKHFYDIISGKTFGSGKKGIALDPYQALWLIPRLH